MCLSLSGRPQLVAAGAPASGHTPEHISLLVTDRSRGEGPTLLLAGGVLLVGDVGRPDLLGSQVDTERHARER